MKTSHLPKYYYRIDDGFRFTLQKDGKYTMDKSEMNPKHRYQPASFLNKNFTEDKKDIRIKEIQAKSNSHS